nr:unnamed protein product [Digitaria exilis]
MPVFPREAAASSSVPRWPEKIWTSTAGAASRTSSRISTTVAAPIRRPHGTDSSLRMLSSCPLTSPWPPPPLAVAGLSSGLSSLLSPVALPIAADPRSIGWVWADM